MLQRIGAWILLFGFLLLLINIIFIHYQLMISLIIYAIIAVLFIFNINKSRNTNDDTRDD